MAVNWEQEARKAAIANGIDPDKYARQIGAESSFKPGAHSGAGAIGIAQIMPATAKGWGVNPNDPKASLNAAAHAMGKYLNSYGGDWGKALAAYNAGPGAVAKYHGIPPFAETQEYVKRILGGSTATKDAATPTTSIDALEPTVSAANDPKTQALEFIFKGSPFAGMASARYATKTPTVATTPATPTPRAGALPDGAKDYRWIQQQGEQLFGLRNDPGNSQTTGGKHTDGSEHYSGRAVDFGNARNTPKQLAEWQAWAKAQGLDVLNEGDHIHVSLPGHGT